MISVSNAHIGFRHHKTHVYSNSVEKSKNVAQVIKFLRVQRRTCVPIFFSDDVTRAKYFLVRDLVDMQCIEKLSIDLILCRNCMDCFHQRSSAVGVTSQL